jgi:hypothetical protein
MRLLSDPSMTILNFMHRDRQAATAGHIWRTLATDHGRASEAEKQYARSAIRRRRAAPAAAVPIQDVDKKPQQIPHKKEMV